MMSDLAISFTADGTGTFASGASGAGGADLRGAYVFITTGGHGGGTLTLQISPDDGVTWVAVPSATFTAATPIVVDIPTRSLVRGSLAGSTAPTLTLRASSLVIQD